MILSFGELLVDMIMEGGAYVPYPGGAPANFAVAVSRLGQKVRLMASVGKEGFGDFLVEHLGKEGVDTSLVKRSEKRTTLAFVELKDGIPDFFFYRGADTDINPNDIDARLLKGVGHLHCGGFSLASTPVRDALFSLLEVARNNGVRVSFSPNTRPDVWSSELDRHLHRTLDFVDILIASRPEFEHLSRGTSPRGVLERYGIDTLIITKGRDGSELFSKGRNSRFPAFNVSLVDSTGSGDAFAAGIVCGLVEGRKGRDLLRFASAVAGISVTRNGAMSALPTRKQVDDFFSKNP
jgi:fructokinase